jgi:hypothetical protein
MNQEKLDKADWHAAESQRLKQEAFDERPLPDRWRVGQKVRMITDTEWAWRKGAIMIIVGLHTKYDDVFYTSPLDYETNPHAGSYWTTPEDVELVEDV